MSKKLEYRVGNLIDTECDFIAHGCNAQGVMGSGVAKALKEWHPKVYDGYREAYISNRNSLPMGAIIPISNVHGKTVINCITQEFYGRESIVYLDYMALADCLEHIETYITEVLGLPEGTEVAFPKIGAGLAGGDWTIISKLLEVGSSKIVPIIYVLDESEIPEQI
jgi:O-acetyl-ADP-ribose deacetylase (regulator of RNase III)